MNILFPNRKRSTHAAQGIFDKYDLNGERVLTAEEAQEIISDFKQAKKSKGSRDFVFASCLLLSIVAITSLGSTFNGSTNKNMIDDNMFKLHSANEAESSSIIPRQLSTNDMDFDDWISCEAMATVPLKYLTELGTDMEETESDEPVFLCKPSPGACETKSSSVPSSNPTTTTTETPTNSPTNSPTSFPTTKNPSNLPTMLPTKYTTKSPTADPTNSVTTSPTYAVKTIDVDWIIPYPEPSLPSDTAKVGDTVTFSWSANHNVYSHPTNNCERDGRSLIGLESPASYTFTQDDIGVVTFACDVGVHCQYGQIISFTVTGDEDEDEDNNPSPTKAITKSPTASPVVSSTQSPTISSSCGNNPLFILDENPMKTCFWIGSVEKRRMDLCAAKDIIRENCPVTCGLCCVDDPDFTFPTPNGNQGCDYLRGAQLFLLMGYCSSINTNTNCPVACGTCASAVTVAPTPSGTISPTPASKTIPVDWFIPGPNDTLYGSRDAKVGDTVVFSWPGVTDHNVFIHPTKTCETTDRILVSQFSPAPYTFTEEDVGVVTFSCDVGNHCVSGQLIAFTVTGSSV